MQGWIYMVRIIADMTTLLKHTPTLGKPTKDCFLQMLLARSENEEYSKQLVARKTFIASTAQKKEEAPLINQGMIILNTPVWFNNDIIKVWTLVNMYKFCVCLRDYDLWNDQI